MYKLLYIGKSNKKFTHNYLYDFRGSPSFLENDEDDRSYMNVTLYGNSGRLVNFYIQHLEYFNENFRLVNEKQIKQFQRQQKLKKINESTTP